jgi:transcriptional regulator with XRE-family HTH domain
MPTRETRLDRGRRRGRQSVRKLVNELADARRTLSLSQQAVADAIGCSQSEISRLENLVAIDGASLVELSSIASVLGLELSVGLHPVGEPLRDKGHQALIARLRAILSPAFRVIAEAPLPTLGDRRAWDLLLRLPQQLIGVEAETSIRDMQTLVRHTHQRERDGGADVVLLVLADSRTNRRLENQLRQALGPSYGAAPRALLKSLRNGQPLPGSGVVLL